MSTPSATADRQALLEEIQSWEDHEVAAFLARQKEKKATFHTFGGLPLKRTYTAADLRPDLQDALGLPGRYPFTRGPYPTMYRSRNWTMRQIEPLCSMCIPFLNWFVLTISAMPGGRVPADAG